jgi:NAD(P)-dependent dehydrogenase (short-subunit alcohol dehydrogenase family)
MRPLVLITGTSSGIGLATAVACAEAKFRVIATMRDPTRAEALREEAERKQLEIHLEQLDVTGGDVGSKVRELVLKYGPIEALVNNAGIAVGGVFEEQSDADVREQFETNVFGAMAVTRALLPAMRTAQRGHIINVSSISGRVGFPCLSVYAATKHALGGFSDALRHELAGFGIHVCVVEPGTFKTAIYFGNQRRGDGVDMEGPYADLNHAMEKILLEGASSAPGPEPVAAKIVELLEAPNPPFRTVLGRDARAMAALQRVMPDGVFATGLRRLMGL